MRVGRRRVRKASGRSRLWWRIALTAALAAVLLLLSSRSVHEETGATRLIAPGVVYAQVRTADGPHEVRVLRIRRDEPTAQVDVGMAQGVLAGLAPLSGIVRAETGRGAPIVAAVNGDFFRMVGQSREGAVFGMTVCGRELVKIGRHDECFYLTDAGTPGIGILDVEGSVVSGKLRSPIVGLNNPSTRNGVTLYTRTWGWAVDDASVVCELVGGPLRSKGRWNARVVEAVGAGSGRVPQTDEVFLCPHGSHRAGVLGLAVGSEVSIDLSASGLDAPMAAAVGGNWPLLDGGRIVTPRRSLMSKRHPRTAVGYSKDEIVLLTCDGRQPQWSTGLFLDELAQLMLDLGCTDALNLDGGGSTTMWVEGEVVNHPSDGRERPIGNAVLVRSSGVAAATGER